MKVYKSKETLDAIANAIINKKHGAYLRFGDGDFMLAENLKDKMQYPSDELSKEMRQSIGLNGDHVFKSIPLYCQKYGMNEYKMTEGTFLMDSVSADNLLKIAKKYWNADIKDVYSHVALHYTSAFNQEYCINFLKFIKNLPNVILVGNENVPDNIKESLFGKNRYHVKTPQKNSYEKINEIEVELNSVINDDVYTVIITFMGCSGRVLQKRIYLKHKNVFLFDFGSLLDALCGWISRTWILKKNINSSFLDKI